MVDKIQYEIKLTDNAQFTYMMHTYNALFSSMEHFFHPLMNVCLMKKIEISDTLCMWQFRITLEHVRIVCKCEPRVFN